MKSLNKKQLKTLALTFHLGITYAKSDKKASKILKLRNKIFKKNSKWRNYPFKL